MGRISILFGLVSLFIPILILGGVYSDRVNAFLQLRIPQLQFEGENLLLWGLVVLAAFVLGLVVMFMLLYP